MNKPLIYIILLNYNGYKDTIECINSLLKINYQNYKIIIVDNNSKDDSEQILRRKKYQNVFIIQSGDNLGFAGGNNIGIKYALENNADYILLLNNDTLVEREFLDKMIQTFIKNSNVGIVGSKIMYYPEKGKIWYGGGEIDWFKFIGKHYGIKEKNQQKYNYQKEVTFMTGCCMLIKRQVFESVGLLSQEYFMYFEDVDFCVKVQEAGYKIIYNPKAVIYHKVSIASGGEDSPFLIKWATKNRILFMNKYSNRVNKIQLLLSKIFFYSTRVIRYIKYVFMGDKERACAIIQGIKGKF